jgi:uracil-DNA glycosylase family 4
MQPTGKGRRKILVVAEAPGESEDLKGIQLIGKSGQLLRNLLHRQGVDLDRDCWKTNAVICRPKGNVTPSTEKINCCLPNLLNTIKQCQPTCIILLGGVSVQSLIGYLTDGDVKNRGVWMGYQIPSRELNAWVCPTYHPAYLLRMNDSLVERLTEQHLAAACEKAKARPYKNTKPFEDQIDVAHKPSKAIPFIRDVLMNKEGTFAFDYETNCLKPEYKGAMIYSCSICWNGKRTTRNGQFRKKEP